MAPVQLVETFEANVNVAKLEHLLHVFFGEAQVEVEVVGENGRRHTFDVPLDIIGEAVHHLVNGDIRDYQYDSRRRRIVRR